MDDLRVAVLGYGLAGSVFHAPLVAATPGLRVSTVVTGRPERADQARAEHPGVRVVATADEVWADPAAYDLVVVATTNDTHVPLARTAVDLGLPVVVDKPLAPTAGEARELVEHAAARAVPLTVFQNRRWDSDQLTLRRLLAEGRLGDVLRYESRYERWRPVRDPERWREAPGPGGGLLLDLGSHLADQAQVLFGPPMSVYAEVEARRGGADDDVFLALRHRSGVFSHLWVGVLAAAPGPRLRVLGSAAAYVVPALDGQEEALRAGRRPTALEWYDEPRERWGRLVRGGEEEPVPSERGAWPVFYAGVAAMVRDGGSPPVDPRDAVRVLELLEAARRSAQTGQVVALD
jgi:scyllo-inositol 2-dehydrogenase (NADP+)